MIVLLVVIEKFENAVLNLLTDVNIVNTITENRISLVPTNLHFPNIILLLDVLYIW